MKYSFLVVALAASLYSCSPKIGGSITSSRIPLEPGAPVAVIGLDEPDPDNAETLGSVKIGDTGFTLNCTYDEAIDLAMIRAREVGGNALKLNEIKGPSAMGSSCYRIKAQIMYVPDSVLYAYSWKIDNVIDEALRNENCAMIHIYRPGGLGALISYNVHANDKVIARISDNSKAEIKLEAVGTTTIWARTESKTELSLDLKPGRHYYIRCGVSLGLLVGHPTLMLVTNNNVGRQEYGMIKLKNLSAPEDYPLY